MAEYSSKGGRLKLKGEKVKKKRKRKAEDCEEDASKDPSEVLHEMWRRVHGLVDVRGQLVLITRTGAYVSAQDDGFFVEGMPSEAEKRKPEESELFLGVPVGDTQLALKSAYGKFLAASTSGDVIGRSDAMGSREIWDPIFQDGLIALEGSNHRYLTVGENGKLLASSQSVTEESKFTLRTSMAKAKKAKTLAEEEYGQKMSHLEVDYVKKFQSFQDHHLRVNQTSRDSLYHARDSGKLHESLLDRREKMKADRYCK